MVHIKFKVSARILKCLRQVRHFGILVQNSKAMLGGVKK